jgi:hypothetical protein
MGCMVPQQLTAGGNQSYSDVLGHNRWPTVPIVNYPIVAPEPAVEQVARAYHSTVGGIGTHMILWALLWDSPMILWG